MLPSASDLQYFIELYNIKNFSRAAERLGITQPSLSISIKRLESSLDLNLFNRSKSGAIPTKEADILAKDVEFILSLWMQVGEKAKDVTQTVRGNIKLGCHQSVAMYAIKPWINGLLEKYQDLSISFEHDLSRKILEQVVSFKLDLGLVINPVQHPDLVIKPILKDEVTLRVVINKTYNKKTIIYDPALMQVQSILKRLKSKNIVFDRHITTSSLELINQMTELGLGVGVLPGKVSSLKLQEFNSSIKPFKDELCIIYRADASKTKSFEVILEAIKRSFKSV